jgi:predicted nucleic acid-binding Zn ribbon protein
MNCPTCDYEFDLSRGLQCPRCGEAIDCGEIGCANCDACSSVFERLGRRVRR